jgi:predicted SnoaL-like aldol condensation-catalyzing enzyme
MCCSGFRGIKLFGAAIILRITSLLPSRAPPLRAPVVEGEPVRIASHPNPVAQLASVDAALAANKRLVFDVWRSIVNGGRVELADELLAPGYIQHSPLLPTGREAFKGIFSAVPRSETIPAVVSPPLVAILAEHDLVAMALKQEVADPDGGGTFTTTHFNLFRVENGRLAEHWHSLEGPPGPNVLPADAGGPQRITGRSGTQQFELLESADAELARNKRLVFDLWRNVVDAGREEAADLYLAEDYIEHDPSAATGRAAFKVRYSHQDDRPIETSLRAPLVAMIAEGDLVVQVVMHEHAHPSRKGDTYTTASFDMYRIAAGRIIEHWNAVGEPAFGGN